MPYVYHFPLARHDLADMADRDRHHWSWQQEGQQWVYAPGVMWRAEVKATESGFQWSFIRGRVRVPGGKSRDIAVMFKAIKAGPVQLEEGTRNA